MRDRAMWVALVSALVSFGSVSSANGAVASVTVHVPGYTYAPFVTVPVSEPTDLELDPSGNVYLCVSGDIRRITPAGVVSPWSSATAGDVVFTGAGDAYGAGGVACNCILSILGNGAYSTLHADSFQWTHVTLGSDGTLYSNIWAGLGEGIYSIDRVTGVPTSLVAGGPGPAGSGSYQSMIVGLDGKLYACGSSGGVPGLFRLDGSQFTRVGTWPDGCSGLAQDNQGIFYTSIPIIPLFGPATHEVWMCDPNTGTATLLADGSGGSNGLAYDRSRNLLYVQNGPSVYTIGKGPTPTRRETWGAVKAKFH